ncbi:MAG: murein biosynthesis integral membrane protein MurJ [Candidatus Omnitrophica bacterium]|nr:murein biosynthesis integral membrane protein MurJ [Candidatus Omnitrophota bacterium]
MDKHEEKHILRSVGTIGFLTFLSRIVGMARDIVSARLFGTGKVWDAFILAFMIPNFLRRLVGEGALINAFVPVYTQVLEEKGRHEADRVANIVFTILLFGLAILTLGVTLIVSAVLSCFTLPDKLILMLRLLVILFPYVLFVSFEVLSIGVLNCHRHFFMPSFAPILSNLIWMGAILFICPFFGRTLEEKAMILSCAVVVSGGAQFLIQLFPLAGMGFRFRIIFDFFNPALQRIIWLVLPSILGFAVVQVNILVDMTLGFMLGDGANSALWYGNRMMQFPLGVFAIAVGTALLPTLSKHIALKNTEEAKKVFVFSLKIVMLVIVPASFGLIALASPIIRLLFERGSFTAQSTLRSANTMMYYCLGLFAYSGSKVVVSGFYSHQDTRTPVAVGAICMVLNIIFNLVLMWPLKEGGLALATAISGTIQFFLLLYLYRKRFIPLDVSSLLPFIFKVLVLSAFMTVVALGCFNGLMVVLTTGPTVRLGISLFTAITAGTLSYFALGLVLRVEELRSLFSRSNWVK